MVDYVEKSGLKINTNLYNLMEEKILKNHPFIKSEDFWPQLSILFAKFTPKNQAVLDKRDELQDKFNKWYKQHPGKIKNLQEYKQFLSDIGYLIKEPEDFTIKTTNIDKEISSQPGPQLVVPALNERYSLNAANARWGSLYDALYGTDVISSDGNLAPGKVYNPKRGEKVVKYAKDFLDKYFPLEEDSHQNVTSYQIDHGFLLATLGDGKQVKLKDNSLFVGYQGELYSPSSVLLLHNGLHVNIKIDSEHPIGKLDLAGVKDVILESAISAIIDLEDSMVAVDGEDKAKVYENLLGLMKGDLVATFEKNGKVLERKLNKDLDFIKPDNSETFKLKGRSLLLFRSVGFLMKTPAILNDKGEELPECILDDVIIALISHYDFIRNNNNNSKTKSIYIVKPKMHGPEEVALADEILADIEKLVNLPKYTIKIGIMDEERRTTLNLKACIKNAENRVIFINTGFLDRTGDEIHTSIYAGAMVKKGDMKKEKWLESYELNNVNVGLACGFVNKGQIGKGMWAMTDLMKQMVEEKIAHPKSGATTAWVPSPTGATLHAMHYHAVDVLSLQEKLLKEPKKDLLDDLLSIPLASDSNSWTKEEILKELDNNCQSILGYVVRWVEQGIGCSKVPDIYDISLMEDRATLRISSQSLTNWLLHDIITKEQVESSLQKMAKVVDEQNKNDINYIPMVGRFDTSPAFLAAKDLIFKGLESPSGYVEPILHAFRIKAKQSLGK